MYVRLLSGRYAGEERDIRADAARVMLRDGRAELPFANGGVVDGSKIALVGESVIGSILPAVIAARFEAATSEIGGSVAGVKHLHVAGKRKKA